MKNILAVGTMAFDSIETPAGKAERVLGGSVSHFAMGASLFVPVSVIAVVGEDFTKEDFKVFEGRQIDTSGVEILPGQTFAWGGKYSEDFHNRETLFTHLNVLTQFQPKLSPEHKKIEHIFLGNVDPKIQLDVLKQMEDPSLIVLDTMNYWIEKSRPELLEVLKLIDILIINDTEALQLAETLDMDEVVKKILDMIGTERQSSPTLVIKQAEKGASAYRKDARFHVPAISGLKVVDPTGAGDSFAGGFVGHLAQTGDYTFENIKKALYFGCSTASFNLEGFGLEDLKLATYEKVIERFNTLKT
jgi:sugar/nucleoside kinase (ribokinase family)